MDALARSKITLCLIITLLILFPATFTSMGNNNPGNVNASSLESKEQFLPSQNEVTIWYHDGSNTTGWTTSYNGKTLNSSGTALYSNATSSGSPEHAVFSYNLDPDFVVGYDLKFEAQIQYTPTGLEDGGLNLLGMDGSQFVWRLAYTGLGSNKVSWALNHYTGQSDVYDSEYTMSYVGYSYMWLNTTNDYTQTNLGDGVVSDDTHAVPARKISSIVLDFWVQNSATYPDFRIDWLRITGGVVPQVDSPDDIEMEYSDTTNLIWTPDSYAPDEYELYIDDVLEDTISWDGSPITIPLTGLDPDYYKYEIKVYDELGYSASDIVYVNVTDTTAPSVENVDDFNLPYGAVGEYLNWTCSEPYPDYFIITNESVVLEEGSWNGSSLAVLLDGLAVGSYIFDVTCNDTAGNQATDSVNVTVITDAPPVVTPLSDDTIELGSTGNTLTWVCSDDFPISYNITRNGTEIVAGAWNGSSLSINIDGLGLGIYVFELELRDYSDNVVTTNATIHVTDTQTPTIEGPADFEFEVGETGQSILWNASDLAPSSYVILQDNVTIVSLNWDGSNIQLDLDALSLVVGEYNFTIVFYDTTGNFATDTVIVTVTASSTTTTTTITTTTTTTSTTTITTTSTTSTGEPLDPLLYIAIGAIGALLIVGLLLMVFKKR